MSYVQAVLGRVANDIKAIANRVGLLERNLHYLTPRVSTERSDMDADGVYRRLTHLRPNNTVFQVSQLAHDPLLEVVNGVYNKRTISLYNTTGTVVVETVSYHIKYDEGGALVSEILIP